MKTEIQHKGGFPRELMPLIPDLNQCLAAAALHYP